MAKRGERLRLVGEVEGRPVAVVLARGRHRVGSAADNDLVLPNRSVSRHHALFEVGPGETTLVDLGSRNGTFVNGTPVERSVIREGDLVHFGPVGLSVGRTSPDEVDLTMEVACVMAIQLDTGADVEPPPDPGPDAG